MTILLSIVAILSLCFAIVSAWLLYESSKREAQHVQDIKVQNAWLQFLAKKYEELWRRYDTKVAWKLDTKRYTISYNIEKNTVEVVKIDKLAKGQQGGTNGTVKG